MPEIPLLSEHFPPLRSNEALIEAHRCLFCYDAPCTHACPTHIDVPRFIKKIASDNLPGSAKTIFESNLLGATCSRVCPVEELCEGACVLGPDKPIAIGRLQRYAMDYASAHGISVATSKTADPKRVAVIGSGAAGLSCGGELARRGHKVTIFEKRDLAGGLSTYGIISLREPVPVALGEAGMIARLGVTFRHGLELGETLSLAELKADFDAIFLAVGMGEAQALQIPDENLIEDGLAYIEQSKTGLPPLRVGRHVVIIGAGNTAIDCATIARRAGAHRVTMLYRRTEDLMTAYAHEYAFARSEGIEFRFLTQPVRVLHENGRVTGLECVRTEFAGIDHSGRRSSQPVPGSEFILEADQIVKAIGQRKRSLADQLCLATEGGYIQVDEHFETSLAGVYAGGDCIRTRGAASTVMAVQDGKLAAAAILQSFAAADSQTSK